METFTHTPKTDLKAKYPGSSAEAIDFLNRVLVFNPYFRMSLSDCLEHPLFSSVRDKSKENVAKEQIALNFESLELNRDRLRELILQECSHFKQ